MAHAVWAEPLAVWDGCQGRREARVVIRFIALRTSMDEYGRRVPGGGGEDRKKSYLVARERVAVIFVAYEALVRRV